MVSLKAPAAENLSALSKAVYAYEYPDAISSRLQHLIDHVWQKGKLYLMLCGSAMSFMQNQVLGSSLDDALIENLFDRSAYLFEEPENLLKQELRKPAMYNSIIRAIAEGASKLNEIATKVGLSVLMSG
jgi:hypothetical protein